MQAKALRVAPTGIRAGTAIGLATLVAGLAIGGCGSVTPLADSGPPTIDQRANVPEALAAERRWLASWFKGTPVRIGQRPDGALTVEVPREFSFGPGRSSIEPALAAVLDKVAESLRRVPLAELTLLAAPDDRGGTSSLAVQRAAQVHRYLRSRGVAATRLGKPTATTATAVQLRLESADPL